FHTPGRRPRYHRYNRHWPIDEPGRANRHVAGSASDRTIQIWSSDRPVACAPRLPISRLLNWGNLSDRTAPDWEAWDAAVGGGLNSFSFLPCPSESYSWINARLPKEGH